MTRIPCYIELRRDDEAFFIDFVTVDGINTTEFAKMADALNEANALRMNTHGTYYLHRTDGPAVIDHTEGRERSSALGEQWFCNGKDVTDLVNNAKKVQEWMDNKSLSYDIKNDQWFNQGKDVTNEVMAFSDINEFCRNEAALRRMPRIDNAASLYGESWVYDGADITEIIYHLGGMEKYLDDQDASVTA